MSAAKATKVLQLYYTSCRRGLSGYSGFQTRAESEGVLVHERREIETKALYVPPRALPCEPDADSIAGQFPKAFRTATLSTGRIAIIRAVYSGQDYSGRWGNYFAHALLLDGELDDLWPIDFYAWTGWVGGLADSAGDSDPTPLPLVQLDDIAARTDFSLDEIKTFLTESQGREETLAQMLRAVFRRKIDSRSVVIRELCELDGVYWVACIQKAFPPTYQRELTCSTFQFDPGSALAVNVTIGETDFRFDEGERKYQFYVFDFATGQHSDVPDTCAEYARVLSTWLASDPSRVKGFHEFASLFDHQAIGADLPYVLQIYRLEVGDVVELTTAELRSILQFVRRHARPVAVSRLLQAAGDLLLALDSTASPEDWALVVRFLVDSAAATGDAEHRRKAGRAWVNAFDALVVDQQRGEDVVVSLRAEVEKTFGADARVIAEEFLSDAHLDWVCENAARLPARGIGHVMDEIVRSSSQLGRGPSDESRTIRSLIEAVLYRQPGEPSDLQWAFTPYCSNVDGLETIAEHVVTVLEGQIRDGSMPSEGWPQACRVVGRSLADVLAKAGETLRFELVNRLKQTERFSSVLFWEWERSIERATDKIVAHANYERNVLSDNSRFSESVLDRITEALIQVLPPASRPGQARSWVEAGRSRRFSNDVAHSILALASRQVGFCPEDQASELLAARISVELRERGLRLNPDRLALREAAARALSVPDGAAGLRSLLERSDAGSYGEFVAVVLPGLLSRANNPNAHRCVLLAVALGIHLELFAEVYLRILSQWQGDHLHRLGVVAPIFWLRLGKGDSAWPLLGRLREPALDVIAMRIASAKKKLRTKVEACIDQQLELEEPEARRAWESVLGRLNLRRPSWLARIFGNQSRYMKPANVR